MNALAVAWQRAGVKDDSSTGRVYRPLKKKKSDRLQRAGDAANGE
jgi:hypothetical protein